MKLSKRITPIPSGSVEKICCDKGLPEGTAAHQVLETSLNPITEMYLVDTCIYITCRPNIGHTITTLSKFLSKSSDFTTNFFEDLQNIYKV